MNRYGTKVDKKKVRYRNKRLVGGVLNFSATRPARRKNSHIPVLLNEALGILEPKPGKVIVDGTMGSGGHAIPIMEKLAHGGIFLGIDWDPSSRAKLATGQATKHRSKLKKLILRVGNYADLPEILREEKIGKVDGVLLDLGFSSEQLEAGRGFSFIKDEPLLMTYSEDRMPAYQALKQLNKKELEEIIRNYGEERYAGRIAKAIWEKERKQPIKTSGELQAVIRQAVPKSYDLPASRLRSRRRQAGRGRINPATRTFMALRIYVNDELGNLERFLESVPKITAKGGRVAIISFHSLEDRLVKNSFRELAKGGRARILTKKPITPTEEETRANPRSRSAKLRAIEMI